MTADKKSKCVFVIDDALPAGLAANTAAVLATALSCKVEGLVGWDVADAEGCVHPAITRVPFPMLKARSEELARLHAEASGQSGVLVAGFSETAQRSRSYDEYAVRLGGVAPGNMRYLGLVLFGERGSISRLTGHLELM